MSFQNRCNECENCEKLSKVARAVCPNPPFKSATQTDIDVWNDAVTIYPCLFEPTHTFMGEPVREITQDEYCARTHEPKLVCRENILFFEYADGRPSLCIAWYKNFRDGRPDEVNPHLKSLTVSE